MGSLLGKLTGPETPGAPVRDQGRLPSFRGWNQRLKQFVMIKNRLAFFIY